MHIKQSNINSVYVKYNAKIRALPIGGLICLSSSPMFSDKIIALKQTNMTLLVISYSVFIKNVSYVAVECVDYMYIRNRYIYMHMSTEAPNVSTSILLDYTSYSQIEWRYIRNMLGKAAVSPIVMHNDFFDTAIRHLSMFDLSDFKSTFLMFLQFGASNISINCFSRNMYTFIRLIVRSRTVFNVCIVDMLSQFEDTDYNSQEDIEQIDWSELDDDEEYKASIIASEASNFALEQELSVAGVRLLNNVYSLSNMSFFLNFSYLEAYNNVSTFISLFKILLLSNLAYFVQYVWLESQLYALLCYKCTNSIFINEQIHYYY
jgi:hypothetical protein